MTATATAIAPKAPPTSERPDPCLENRLQWLEDRLNAMRQSQGSLRDAADEILLSLPADIQGSACVRLPTYKIDHGNGFVREKTPEPISFLSEQQIIDFCRAHGPGNPHAMIKKYTDMWLADRARIQSARAEAGYTDLSRQADQAADEIERLEREIRISVPVNVAGLSVQIRLLTMYADHDEKDLGRFICRMIEPQMLVGQMLQERLDQIRREYAPSTADDVLMRCPPLKLTAQEFDDFIDDVTTGDGTHLLFVAMRLIQLAWDRRGQDEMVLPNWNGILGAYAALSKFIKGANGIEIESGEEDAAA